MLEDDFILREQALAHTLKVEPLVRGIFHSAII